jgi:hypothetical protein
VCSREHFGREGSGVKSPDGVAAASGEYSPEAVAGLHSSASFFSISSCFSAQLNLSRL